MAGREAVLSATLSCLRMYRDTICCGLSCQDNSSSFGVTTCDRANKNSCRHCPTGLGLGSRKYLVSVEPVEKGDADHGRLDASQVGHRGKHQSLHLHIDDTLFRGLKQYFKVVPISDY